ncbi:UNVERIFIED_CONTAM: hypothetical protein GTU68_041531 [Idotea baltica]|nr:hypothetical protein [Idotea baltica]
MLMIWFERKVVSDMQNRIGPNVAGPFGILQTLADGIKAFFKEDLIPAKADKFIFKLAPFLSIVPALVVFTVIPIGGNFSDPENPGGVADPHVGILVVLAMSSMAVYGITLAGWSSGSKYPLLGAVRGTAQMVSYEAALGLALIPVLMNSGSLSTTQIVSSQSTWSWNLWATGVIPFVVFFIAVTAELNRPPFDLVEAEQELVGGFHTEYSGIRFALFFLAEFMNVVTMSAVMVTLFLGGPSGPALMPTVYFMVKLLAFLFTFVWMRGSLPRLRYDQLMDLGWKVLIPLSLGWVVVLISVGIAENEGWNRFVAGGVALLGTFAGAMLLMTSIRVSKERRSNEEVLV